MAVASLSFLSPRVVFLVQLVLESLAALGFMLSPRTLPFARSTPELEVRREWRVSECERSDELTDFALCRLVGRRTLANRLPLARRRAKARVGG
jgi:hypothetical protein